MTRYALYFAPAAESALWRFGSGVLGYDAAAATDVPLLPMQGLDAEAQRALTADPRRYGFHATLKAPFSLGTGVSEDDLIAILGSFAAKTPAARMEGLAATLVGGRFVALTPVGDPFAVNALAAAVVTAFEPLRAPLTPEDFARRRPERLGDRQRDYLQRFGYHLVFEEFRFHMTLTGALPEHEGETRRAALEALFVEHVPQGPVMVDRLALFRQPAGTDRFRIVQSVLLAG